ncbi:DUF1016 N-terminal domain-containing protein [Fluviicola sp.]|jgi:hypothetical protein|uniref:DUF1016 N-terminal domain-containing protein n=1 Tax=Fluviicola sp. TaxID=1917219 RepID=UPI00281B9349|nr:DUF1016 N-terminal domain-containing protein [Fluviicola sp.]MDR0802923.1 DUF1016 N-terminal domain-containing protein [Fluviicola sp.]
MELITEIKQVVYNARKHAYQAINSAMVEAYWQIGRRIVEEEQQGSERAAYGKEIIKNLSEELTKEFGKGFSERTLREFRQFYLYFSDLEIQRTLFAKLNWSHFQRVLKVSDEKAREFYLTEAAQNMWSVRTLDRNISTLYYQRLISTQKKELNNDLSKEPIEIKQYDGFIKNPSVLEFLNLPSGMSYTEEQFESALIDNLQKFILEVSSYLRQNTFPIYLRRKN